MTDLSTRYGTRSRRPWLLPAIIVIALVIALSWVVWVATADQPFQARLYGYDVIGEHSTTVKLDINRPKPVGLECTVYAQADDHSIVGERTLTIPASPQVEIRTSANIMTERRAVTGILKGCVLAK